MSITAMLAAAVVGVGVPTLTDSAPASAADGQSCSYASPGTGQYANTICWLDLSAFSQAEASSADGQQWSFAIAGGYTLSFTMNISGGTNVESSALPTFNRAYLGQQGHYSGIAGKPGLIVQANANSGTETITQSNIRMTDAAGRVVSGWALVSADAESTDDTEYVQWDSSNSLQSLTTQPDGSNGLGNACAGGFTGVGTTSVRCTGTDNGDKTGAAILATTQPTTFSTTATYGGGQEGPAFGVLVSKVTLDKTVASRVSASDSFDTSITSPEGTVNGSATTGTASSSTTGSVTVLPRTGTDGNYTLAEAASAGSSPLGYYGQNWVCTNSVATSTTPLPSGDGTSKLVNPAPGDDITCTVTNTAATFSVAKVADQPAVTVGDDLQYTVTVTNTGAVPFTADAPASFSDDFSAVLDDASYNDDATASAGTVSYTAPKLSWSGPLPVGGSVTVTYSVTVNTPDAGDKLINNQVAGGPGCSGTCTPTVSTPVRTFAVTKTASEQAANPGDTVTYTVTVQSTGTAPFDADHPASITDDLSDVVDDATFRSVTVSSSDGADVDPAKYTAPTLTWSGPLAVGATVTITYAVTVNTPTTGDKVLANTVTGGPGCEQACTPTVQTPIRTFTVTKTASERAANAGDTVTYTVTVTNTGKADYTDAAPASFTDDMSNVLDDATYNRDAKASAGAVSYATPKLSWSGPVPVGKKVTVTYSVTVSTPDTGDRNLVNAVSGGPGCDGVCDPTTSTPVRAYTVSKTASASTAVQGATVNYTVTVTNTGKADYTDADPASFTDDMSNVLDDATYNRDAKASAGAVSYATPKLSWSGPVPVGKKVTVTYSVTVATPDRGDRALHNVVAPTGPGGDCATCETITHVPPGFAVHTGGSASTAGPMWTGDWMVLAGTGIAALLGCAVIWFRRRPVED